MIPHKCPVCYGRGLMPYGFYESQLGQWDTTSITDVTCRSCQGSGIVWEQEAYQHCIHSTDINGKCFICGATIVMPNQQLESKGGE